MSKYDLNLRKWKTLDEGRYIENAEDIAKVLKKDYKYDRVKFYNVSDFLGKWILMKNKKILLAIPSIILPYVLLLVLFTIFSGSGNPISRFIIEDIFAGNGLLLFLAFCIFTFISFVLNIIFFVLSITKIIFG